jgi:hypothetical protein
MLLLPHLLPKLHVLPLIVPHKLLLLLKALLTKPFRPQQKLKPAAMQTARAWTACSRSRCRSKKT